MPRIETFGACIRRLREESGLPIRKVAASLDLDPSTLSKIERDERPASREQVSLLSRLFEIPEKELAVTYLSDKLAYALQDESWGAEALRAAEKKIKYKLKRSGGK